MIGDLILYVNARRFHESGYGKIRQSLSGIVHADRILYEDNKDNELLKVEYDGVYDRTYIVASSISIINPLASPNIDLVYHGGWIEGLINKESPSRILRKLHKKGMTISKEEIKRGIIVLKKAINGLSN